MANPFGPGRFPGKMLLPLGWTLAALLFGSPAHAIDLKVMIDGVASSSGTILVGLYDSRENYESAVADPKPGSLADRRRVAGVAMRAVAGTQCVVFTNLKPGAYAVIVFHDENDNSRLDTNSWGMPLEAYGFSNDARGLLSAPEFRHAAFTLDGADQETRIKLFYPRGS